MVLCVTVDARRQARPSEGRLSCKGRVHRPFGVTRFVVDGIGHALRGYRGARVVPVTARHSTATTTNADPVVTRRVGHARWGDGAQHRGDGLAVVVQTKGLLVLLFKDSLVK